MTLSAQLGDYVRTLFDVGANMGYRMVWGVVTTDGPKAVTVTWESGLRNRVRRDDTRGVEDASDIASIDPAALRRLAAYLPTKACTNRKCSLSETPHRHLARRGYKWKVAATPEAK